MAGRPLDQLTLRELVVDTERVTRELIAHLDQAFTPQVQALEQLVHRFGDEKHRGQVQDASVRAQVATLLTSDDFSQPLIQKLKERLAAIEVAATASIKES